MSGVFSCLIFAMLTYYLLGTRLIACAADCVGPSLALWGTSQVSLKSQGVISRIVCHRPPVDCKESPVKAFTMGISCEYL